MAGFLYYVGTQSAAGIDFVGLGIAPALAAPGDRDNAACLAAVKIADTMRGPDGGRGQLFCLSGPGMRLGYRPSEQTWRKCAGGRFWLGWYENEVPGPKTLARRSMVPGIPVPLAGGTLWQVPIARGELGTAAIPAVLGMDDEGEPIRVVLPGYRSLVAAAAEVADAFDTETGIFGLDEDRLVAIAIEALSANYHVGEWELRALEALPLSSVPKVLFSLIEGHSLVAERKKKAPASDG